MEKPNPITKKMVVQRSIPIELISIPEKDLHIGKYLITKEEYEIIMGPHNPKVLVLTPYTEYEKPEKAPVLDVTWKLAQKFCENLTKIARDLELIPANMEFRLPTCAEWQAYCQRDTNLKRKENKPNAWGFYIAKEGILAWNGVCEWCQDCYPPDPRNYHAACGGYPGHENETLYYYEKEGDIALVGIRIVLAPVPPMSPKQKNKKLLQSAKNSSNSLKTKYHLKIME